MTSDREEVLEYLLDSGADLYLKASPDSNSGRGKTAFHLAAACGQITELGLMIQKMEEHRSNDLCKMKDIEGYVLHSVSCSKHIHSYLHIYARRNRR